MPKTEQGAQPTATFIHDQSFLGKITGQMASFNASLMTTSWHIPFCKWCGGGNTVQSQKRALMGQAWDRMRIHQQQLFSNTHVKIYFYTESITNKYLFVPVPEEKKKMLHYCSIVYNPLKVKIHGKNAKKQVGENLLQFGEGIRLDANLRLGK